MEAEAHEVLSDGVAWWHKLAEPIVHVGLGLEAFGLIERLLVHHAMGVVQCAVGAVLDVDRPKAAGDDCRDAWLQDDPDHAG